MIKHNFKYRHPNVKGSLPLIYSVGHALNYEKSMKFGYKKWAAETCKKYCIQFSPCQRARLDFDTNFVLSEVLQTL